MSCAANLFPNHHAHPSKDNTMTDTNAIQTITAAIDAAQQQRSQLQSLIADRHHARAQIEADLAAARAALDAAQAALEAALAAHAIGEIDAGEVTAARAGVTDATKTVQAAMRREPEAHELAAAARGLAARLAAIDAELIHLRAQREVARKAAMAAELHTRIDAYMDSAAVTMARFADALALDAHLASIGAPQNVRTPETALACLPGFAGHTSNAPNFDDLVNSARLRVFADWT